MRREWLAFLSAVQFLTRLPVPDPGWEEGRLDRAAKWFPLVGALVGLICGVAYLLAGALLTQSFAPPIIAVATGLLVTGALHEDGLADFTDGIGGGQSVERRLEIMKDSRIGSYGALALIIAMTLTITSIPPARGLLSGGFACALLIAAHAVSRATLPIIAAMLPYAREGQAPLSRGMTARTALVLAALSVAALVLFWLAHNGTLSKWKPNAGTLAVFSVGMGAFFALISAAIVAWIAKRKLGGWTGDVLGAAQVISFIAFLLGATAWI